MRKFTLGMIAGMSSLAVAVPLLAQVTSAQTSSSGSTFIKSLPTPTQACAQAMADLEKAHLDNFDTMMATEKQRLQDRVSAMEAIADITDDTERKAALQKMHDNMKANMPSPEDSMPAAVKTATDAAKTACGDSKGMGMMMGGGDMMFFRGPGGPNMKRGLHMEDLSAKLGMTNDELKAALASGKTLQQIAEEKGVDLPTPPEGKGTIRFRNRGDAQSSTSSNPTSTQS